MVNKFSMSEKVVDWLTDQNNKNFDSRVGMIQEFNFLVDW